MTRSLRFWPIAWGLASLAVLLPASAASGDPRGALSFDDRVAAQEAIERVYYRHQLGATLPFEEAVPRGVLERKVRTYLKQSAALAQLWSTPVTAEMLQAEWERIARGSRFPDRLREIHEALGNDPVLIQECFARPALVDRLSRSFYAGDDRFHPAAIENAGDTPGPGRAAAAAGRAWDDWWPETAARLDESGVAPVARAIRMRDVKPRLDANTDRTAGGRIQVSDLETVMSCRPDDTWTSTSIGGAPPVTRQTTAVWTGTQMIVWGGFGTNAQAGLNTGGRYDPLLDQWSPTTLIGAPTARYYHAAVWTGNRMVVWGGVASGYTNTGGRYDPIADSWAATTLADAPVAALPIAIWTGRRMLVWSGAQGAHAQYDPSLDAWSPISTVNAPPSSPTFLPGRGVWTGQEVLIWNGSGGGRYNPASNTWGSMSSAGQPSTRSDFSVVWTGTEMVVFGGDSPDFPSTILGTGARYDPSTNTWTPTPPVTPGRTWHTAVWTGREMVVWGGFEDGWVIRDTGARYDPAIDTWTPTAATGAPEPRYDHVSVWTGGLMIVWGGEGYTGHGGGGGRYALNQSADLDQDGTTFCGGDCDDIRAAVHPGAPEICDGLDNDCDGSLAPFEVDGDGDGYFACADCDDGQPTAFPGNPEMCDNLDNDCNGTVDAYPTSCGVGACARTGSCTAGADSCLPGVPTSESCDGLDNDCNGSVPANESDSDGDGFRLCGGDCNDSRAATYPGAVEVNDGFDNQCAGNEGLGLIDEISGVAGFPNPADTTSFCWPAQTGAVEYEALRSSLASFGSGCGWTLTTGTCWSDLEVPPSGGVFYYLARPTEPNAGSFGRRSSGAQRSGLCGVERVCHDGVDDDADGLVDCADLAACFDVDGCTATFTFVDSASDNVAPTSLQSFLQSLPVTPADYIRFSLTGPSLTDFEWCAARADFYRDQYLALAPTAGTTASGPWDRWHHTEGGPWIGPVSGAHDNLFGDDCVGPYSWCSEFDLGGHVPAIAPADPGPCEVFDYITCSDGTWRVTIEIGADRFNVCGF